MASFLDENDCTWNEMLPNNPMFDRLREKDSAPVINGNILCEIRGDLFVWNDAEKVLLTTNLKRLMAYHTRDDQIYQVCSSYLNVARGRETLHKRLCIKYKLCINALSPATGISSSQVRNRWQLRNSHRLSKC